MYACMYKIRVNVSTSTVNYKYVIIILKIIISLQKNYIYVFRRTEYLNRYFGTHLNSDFCLKGMPQCTSL